MELFTATLTAVLLCLFLAYLIRSKSKANRQKTGVILWEKSPPRRWFHYALGVAMFFLPLAPAAYSAFLSLLIAKWFGDGTFHVMWSMMMPLAAFSGIILFFEGIFFASICAPRGVQLCENGLFLVVGSQCSFIRWSRVRCCQWRATPGKLRVAWFLGRRNLKIPASQIEAVTQILSTRVELRDASGAITNPNEKPLPCPPQRWAWLPRFQFRLKTLLFFMVVTCSASAWLGTYLQSKWREEAALTALAQYNPKSMTILNHVSSLEFSGPKPGPTDEDMVHLKKFHMLDSLDLSGSPATDAGLVHLKNLQYLVMLSLTETNITDAGLANLKEMSHLESLCVSKTSINGKGFAHLKNLKHLETLFAYSTNLTDAGLAQLKELNSLEMLFLADTQITDAGLVHLKNLDALECLSLNKTKITGKGLAHLNNLKRLEGLSLGETAISNEGLIGLSHLDSLKTLNLENTQITDAGLEHLKQLKNLECLDLTGTQVTDEGVRKLQQSLPDTKIRR